MRIKEIAYHRNGIGGEGFYVVYFTARGPCKVRNKTFYAILFDTVGQCAVLGQAELAEGTIAFGKNSWRGDDFEPDLRKAIADWETNRTRSVFEGKPDGSRTQTT